jgi:hypothetical protein
MIVAGLAFTRKNAFFALGLLRLGCCRGYPGHIRHSRRIAFRDTINLMGQGRRLGRGVEMRILATADRHQFLDRLHRTIMAVFFPMSTVAGRTDPRTGAFLRWHKRRRKPCNY